MDVLRALFRSRKFVAALVTMIVSILVALGMPEDIAAPLITSIAAVAVAYIAGTAWEDTAMKENLHILEDDDSAEA